MFFHWRDLQVRKQSNVCRAHCIAKKLLTKTVKSATRKMCYWEKTHNLSKYMTTKLLVQTVPNYMDRMIPCQGQNLVTEKLMPVRE
jgi:hypothetical protein